MIGIIPNASTLKAMRVCRLMAAAVIFAAGTAGAPAHAAIISAPSVTMGLDGTLTVGISITDAIDLTSWQFDLAFDPTIVEVNSVTEGSFLPGFGLTTFTPGVIDNASGLISLVFASYSDLLPNPSGSGVLANIQFHGLAAGVSPIHLSSVFLNGLDQGFVISDDQITVDDDVNRVPEPTTLLLLSCGIAAAAFRARRVATRHLAVGGFAVFASMAVGGGAAAQIVPPNLGDAPVLQTPPQGYPPTVAPSSAAGFFVSPAWGQTLAPNVRFIILTNMNSDAVLDRETGLVWARQPIVANNGQDRFVWETADRFCKFLAIGNRLGWRLPAFAELQTLMDTSIPRSPSLSSPMLPAGHPFVVNSANSYWASDTDRSATEPLFFGLRFGDGALIEAPNGVFEAGALCVRGRQ